MTTTERKTAEKQAFDLLTTVGTRYLPEVAASVIDRFGDIGSMSDWELEEMLDDVISKVNDND